MEPDQKTKGRWGGTPNLLDYEQACAGFSWESVQRELDGLPGGRGLNIAYEAVDRRASGDKRNRLALRWLGKQGEFRDFTYGELAFSATALPISCADSASARAIGSSS